MLRDLHIKNLALIDDATLIFQDGFTVFTGETGAGKSILLGAIGLLLGERASTEHIRSGTDEAEVIGTFEIGPSSKRIAVLCNDNAISLDEQSLIIRRSLSRSGRGKIFINQVPVPLAVLKAIGDVLVDFHGQHEHQSLLHPETAQQIIDTLPEVIGVKIDFDKAYQCWMQAANELAAHDKHAELLAQQKDMLEFQLKELADCKLVTGLEKKLEDELVLLSSTTERAQNAAAIVQSISGQEGPVDVALSRIVKLVEVLSRFDASVAPWIDEAKHATGVFAELEKFCRNYADQLSERADPERLESINGHMAKIQRLKKKYHVTFDELLTKQENVAKDLEALVNGDADRVLLAAKADKAHTMCMKTATVLSKARIQNAASFDKKITGEMGRLGFAQGAWKTTFVPFSEISERGLETIEFFVRTNPGEPFLPLVKTASGGEISRLMLAIKTVLAKNDTVATLIFDEIDTGIGGTLAHEVALAICSLAKSHQVLVISHLHQIASKADHHVSVYKEQQNNRTVTRVRDLAKPQKIDEIARMLGGDSAIARKHAETLLDN